MKKTLALGVICCAALVSTARSQQPVSQQLPMMHMSGILRLVETIPVPTDGYMDRLAVDVKGLAVNTELASLGFCGVFHWCPCWRDGRVRRFRNDDPCEYIRHDSANDPARAYGQDYPDEAHDCGVDIKILAKTTADAGDP